MRNFKYKGHIVRIRQSTETGPIVLYIEVFGCDTHGNPGSDPLMTSSFAPITRWFGKMENQLKKAILETADIGRAWIDRQEIVDRALATTTPVWAE